MMGGSCSKPKTRDSSPPPLQINASSDINADLRAYADACELDPELKSFDLNLHQRTNRVISTLAAGIEVRTLSFDSLKEATGSLLDLNQEVVKVILESKKDIWKNSELFALVEEYFDNSVRTLDFCNAMENCLKRARKSHFILQIAVKQFEEEEELQDGLTEKTYVKTLEELRKFKAAGDPFSEGFFRLFQLVHKQQISLLQKLMAQKKKLDKKMKSMKTWRKVSNVLFVAAFVSVLIFSVVAAAVSAPPVITALAGALTIPIGSIGKWCNSLWNNYDKELKKQKELASSMWIETLVTVSDVGTIQQLVNKLEEKIESLMQNADIALIEDDAVKFVIDEMKKKLEVFMETIEELGAHAVKCSREITQARTVILQRIIRYPD